MELSPEERRKIYEEEKARIEAGERPEEEKGYIPPDTSTGIAPRVAGLLCYLGAWITGIIFFVLEQKNKWVRFHAAQSIAVFGTLFIASLVFRWIPFIGDFFSAVIGITAFILWIVLMVKAYNGERFKVPLAGDLAEMMVGPAGSIPGYSPPAAAPAPPSPPPSGETAPPPSPPPPPPTARASAGVDERTRRRIDEFFTHKREGRITGSAIAIAWLVILFVFFNFFHEYVAYYTGDTVNGVISWTREPFFTGDIGLWLPILNAALAIAVICHIVMILVDKELLRQALYVIMDGFGLATVVTLLVVFPFDFTVIPDSAAASGTQIGVTVVLVLIAIGFGISLLVRFIKLLINIAKTLVRTTGAS